MKTISGFNEESRKGRDAAMKYCQIWQFEITKLSTNLTLEFTGKKITQAVYNLKRDELKKQTDDLNKCIKVLNTQAK